MAALRLLCIVVLVIAARASKPPPNITDCSIVNAWAADPELAGDDFSYCKNCSAYSNCFWCAKPRSNGTASSDRTPRTDLCVNDYEISAFSLADNATCDFCQLSSCKDVCSGGHGFFPRTRWISGEIILMIFYGVVLAFGAKLISDGSECLLEILDPGLIGGLLLPILGAVPDSAIVVVSGAVGSKENAQSQINVGIGTLAGSTIMLLSIPWAVSLWLARTDIVHGESVDGTLTHKWSLTKTGATVDDDTKTNARIMVATAVTYLVIQLAAFKYVVHPSKGQHVEKWCALAGMIVCLIALVLYCTYQVVWPNWQAKRIKAAKHRYRHERFIHNLELLSQEEEQLELRQEDAEKVDVHAVGMKWKAKAAEIQAAKNEGKAKAKDDDDSDSNKGEKPTDWKPIALKAAILLSIGTALVAVFSDPMVDVISDFGDSIGVKAFYVSFVITPVCSNASELISSFLFAVKKKKVNNALVYGQLYGASTINNTLVLGIFYALICFRDLTWDFSSETIAILVVCVITGLVGSFINTYRTWHGICIILLWPAALLFVALMETYTVVK